MAVVTERLHEGEGDCWPEVTGALLVGAVLLPLHHRVDHHQRLLDVGPLLAVLLLRVSHHSSHFPHLVGALAAPLFPLPPLEGLHWADIVLLLHPPLPGLLAGLLAVGGGVGGRGVFLHGGLLVVVLLHPQRAVVQLAGEVGLL